MKTVIKDLDRHHATETKTSTKTKTKFKTKFNNTRPTRPTEPTTTARLTALKVHVHRVGALREVGRPQRRVGQTARGATQLLQLQHRRQRR